MQPEDILKVYADLADEVSPSRRRRAPRVLAGRPWRHVVVAGMGVAVLAAPLGVAATGDALRQGKRNGTTTHETEIIGSLKAKTGKGGYVTRQSNVATGATAGGGAIYGCRTPAGGTAKGTAPCLRASNLANGSAFEFASAAGTAGLFSVGDPAKPNPGKPFTTNATGVATGLNADQVDGQDGPFLSTTPGAVGTTNLADNAVTTGKIADNAVTTAKIASGQVTGSDLGPITVRTTAEVVPNNTGAVVLAQCLAGEARLSGGAFFTGANLAGRVVQSSFATGTNLWAAAGRNTSGSDQTLTVQALCLG